ncbi:MAG: hypothetical protein AAGL49_02850 [Pseudomonadota bacterium]
MGLANTLCVLAAFVMLLGGILEQHHEHDGEVDAACSACFIDAIGSEKAPALEPGETAPAFRSIVLRPLTPLQLSDRFRDGPGLARGPPRLAP